MVKNKSLISLGTSAPQGKLTKESYLEYLNHSLDDYSEIQLTEEEANKVVRYLRKVATGATAMVPLMCAGPKCPLAATCPLQQINRAPIGKPCILEERLLKEWITRYVEEFDIDPNNFTEIGYVNELADLQIQELRINMFLARPENQTMLIDQVMGVDRDGDPIVQKQISPYIQLKTQISNRRQKIIKLMVGDRQEKYKKEAALKIKLSDDPSSQMAAMRGKLESLKRELDAVEPNTPKSKSFSPDDLIAEDD